MIPIVLTALILCTCCCGPKDSRGGLGSFGRGDRKTGGQEGRKTGEEGERKTGGQATGRHELVSERTGRQWDRRMGGREEKADSGAGDQQGPEGTAHSLLKGFGTESQRLSSSSPHSPLILGKLPEDFLATLPMSKKRRVSSEEFELEFRDGYVQRKDSSRTKFSTVVSYIEARRESIWSTRTDPEVATPSFS